MYFVLSILLWVLVFTWPVILKGSVAMITPKENDIVRLTR